MAEKLRIGVVGVGTIGPVHLDAYKANAANCEIAAVCDLIPERVQKHGDAFDVPGRYTDHREMLAKEKLDAVSVCVGNTAHREVAVNALNAGVNVLCEKPTAMNAIEAQAIVDAAEANGRVLQIGMVYRQSAEARLARQYALDGALGQIYHIRTVLIRRRGIPGLGGWFTTKAMSGGGPLIDIGVHWFDLSMFMSDQWNPTAVSAKTYAKFGVDMRNYTYVGMWAGPPDFDGVFDVEDYATGMVRFGSGATMVFDIAWAANTDDAGFIEILGDKGGVRFSPGQPLKVYTEYRGNVADIQPQVQDRGNNFHRQIESFAAACRGEVEPAATGPQGVTAMKIIDGVYASSEQNREVVIG